MPNAFDEFEVAAPATGNAFDQFDAPEPMTDQQFADAGRYWERYNKDQAALHEMNAHDSDALRAIANDPKGFIKSIPGDVMSIATAPGKLAYLSAADVWSHLFGQPEYGGNLTALETGGDVPAEKFLGSTAKEFPKATIAAKVAKSGAEMAPLAVVGILPATLQKLAALGFSAQMIAGAPQQFKDFAEEYYKPPAEQDPDKLSTLWSDVIQTGVFAPLAGAGAAGGVPAGRFNPKLEVNPAKARAVAAMKAYEAAQEVSRETRDTAVETTAPPTEARANPFDEFDAPNVSSAPVPEAPPTLEAQVKLTADPKSSKAATHVTPGETMPEVPKELVTVELPDNKGTLLVNPTKADPAEVAHAAMTGEHGKYLGMGSEGKTTNPANSREFAKSAGEVLQTKVEGVPVQDEVVTPETLTAALEASKKIAPNVTSEVKPAEEVLQERIQSGQGAADAPPQEPRPAEVTPAAGTLPAETGGAARRRGSVAGAKPVAVAQEKMQARVDEVRHPLAVEGEKIGQRYQRQAAAKREVSAKEIKSELVQRLEAAIAKAPESGGGKLTIQIPGDGEFKMLNTKADIERVLKLARALDTRTGASVKVPTDATAKVQRTRHVEPLRVPDEVTDATVRASKTLLDVFEDVVKDMPDNKELPNPSRIQGRAQFPKVTQDLLRALNTQMSGKVWGETTVGKAREFLRERHRQLEMLAEPVEGLSPELEAQKADALAQVRENVNKPVSEGGLIGTPEDRHIAGFGGSPRNPIPRRTTPLPTPAALPPTPPPTHGVRAWLTQRRLAVQSLFAPGNIDAGARAVANTMRELLGQQAIALARAEEAMSTYRREFDHTPVPRDYVYDPSQPLPHNYAVMDAFETNRAALPARYADLAKTFDDEFAWRIKEIQKFAPHALNHLITNYFPHVWKDPVRAADVMNQIATRLFAGRKEFLKQRTLPIFADGLARGLEPISDNPVDLLLAKMHSMDKFITALRFQAEAKEMGAMKFKYIFEAMPDGYGAIEDPAFIVNQPPVVTVKEAVDDFQRAKLGELLTHLGVSYQRVASLGGRRWAEAERGTREIRAKVGASEDILWHEVGHHLDWQFPDLRNSLVFGGHGPLAEQLRALVDLNHPGEKHNPKLSYHKYLRKTEEKMAEMFRAYVHAPDLFRSAAPDVWSVMQGWLGKHPDIASRLDAIRPGLKLSDESTEIKLGGMLTLGQWIMPDGPRTVIENYLSPGLSSSGVYRSLRAASNVLNGAQLGFSAFHLGFTSLDAAVSRASVGLEALLAGKPVDAAMKLASTPLAPITNLISGSRIRSEMLHPGTSPDVQVQQLAKLAVTGGLRATVDPFYKTEFTRKFVRAIHEGTAGGYARAISAAPFAALEQTLRPILEYIVPRQKLGVFADMARLSMEKLGPMAGVEQIREAMAKAADSTENRMGQMVYENLFYNKAVKDLALLSFRAYGWQLGKYREALGAVSDTVKAANEAAHLRKPEFTHRMAYAITLPLVVGAVGGLMHKLWTGQNPEDSRDYFFPRTGKLDVHGRPQRVALPSYMKDLVSDWHDFPNLKKMGTSFYHKLNPGLSMTVDMLRNRDFYDVEIRHEHDPAWKQARDTMAFALQNAKPFSVSGAQKLSEDSSAGAQEYVLPFFGVVPAKKALSMTPAESKAADIIQDLMPAGTRTQSEADKSKLSAELVRTLKENRQQGEAKIRAAARAGSITTDNVDQIITRSLMTPLGYQVQRMPVESALRVWDLANPSERGQIADQILVKIANAKNLAPEQARAWASQIKDWKRAANSAR